MCLNIKKKIPAGVGWFSLVLKEGGERNDPRKGQQRIYDVIYIIVIIYRISGRFYILSERLSSNHPYHAPPPIVYTCNPKRKPLHVCCFLYVFDWYFTPCSLVFYLNDCQHYVGRNVVSDKNLM